MKIRVKLNSEKKTLKNVDLETGTGQATVIKHPANGVYTFQLIDLATNLGPQKIIAKRVGNNLEIAFDDSKTTDLIIENYYREGLEESTIIGLAEDGQYYAYIPENGLASDAIPVLKENVLATEVLGGEGFVAAAIPFVLGWPWVAGGLGLLGAVAALAGGGSGGGSGGSSVANIRLTEGTTAENNRGGFKLDWPAGAEKVEVTFYPEGSHKPLTVTLTKDADGNIISSHPNFIPGVGKDQPIIIPPNSLKDNSPVDVKAFNGNGNVIAQGSGTSAYDADSAPAKVKEAIEQDTDGDGNPNRVKLDLTGPADAPFKVVDKDGKVIAEGTFDKNGEASILAPLDPKNPNRDSKDDLKVITQENGTNRTETALAPAEMVPAPELKPSANPTDPEKSFEVDVKLDNKENTKEIKLDVVDPATGKVTNTITLTKDEKGEFKGPEGVKVENTEEGVKVTLPKDKVPEGSQITASTTNNAGDTSAPSNPVENKQGEEGLVPVKPETLQPSAKPIIESIKAVDSSSPADNNPDEFIVSGTGPANSSITIYGQKGNDKYPIGSTTTDENGKFTVTVTDQDKGVDLVSGDNISVVAHETGKQPTSSDNETIPEVADRTPNNTFVPAPELKPSENPTDPENSFEVDVKLNDKENTKEIKLDVVDPATGNVTNTITLTKDEKGEFKGPEGVKVENTEGGVKVTLPKDNVPEKSQITASTKNNAGETSAPSNPVENKGGEGLKPVDPQILPPSAKPIVESVRAIDTSSPADNNPEEFIVSGTGPKNSSITLYGHKGDEKFPIGSVTTDKNGNFTVTVTDQGKGVDLVSGDKISAEAHETGKQPTPSDEAKEIPAVPAGKEGHTVDTVKPEAKVEIVTHNEPGSDNGSAVVNTSGMKPGDKLVVGLTDETGADKKLEFTMGEDGKLQASGENDPALKVVIGADGTITIDKESLKDGSTISASVVDLADNATTPTFANVGYDEVSTVPTEVTIKAIDTDPIANNTPEKLKVSGKGPYKAGDEVILRDENGTEVGRIELTDDMIKDGGFTVEVPLKNEHKDIKKVSVTVQEQGKGESAPVTVDVPPVPNGQDGHPNDSAEPKSPEVSATEDNVKVKFDPESTDTLTINVQPKDEKGQDKDQPTEIVYEKQPDGSFKPTDPKFPTIPKGKDTVEIPRDKLPTDDLDVTASAGDIAGNSSTSQTTPVEDTKEKSDTPTVDSVKAIDTNKVADKTYERTEIKGTGVKGAEVIATVTDKDGNVVEIGRATVGEDGKFTIRGDVPAGIDITDTKNINVTAKEPDKRTSDPVNKEDIPAAEITHPSDVTAPELVVLPTLPNAPADKLVGFDPKDINTITVEYIDNEGNPKTAEITRNSEGKLESKDPNIVVADNMITIKGEGTKDNTPIKVTATDLAGNQGEPLVISSGSNVPVIDENQPQPNQPNVPSQPTVTEQPAAGDNNPAGKKDVVVKFPTDANEGDKVNVTYTPAPTDENPNPKPVVETFTKTPDGWKKPDGSTLPDVTNDNQGNPELVIPGDKVKDGSSVIVNAVNAEGSGRTEDAILDKTTPDGDGKELPPVEKMKTPTNLVLESIDSREGGDRSEPNPDSFTLTGRVEGAPEGTEVIIKNGEDVVGKGKTDKDGNFSIDFTDKGKNEDIAKGTELSVIAQKPGQPETASEQPGTINVDKIEFADKTPPTVDLAPVDGGAQVTPDPKNPLKEGDTITIKVTPPATENNQNPQTTEHTYTVDKDGNLQPNSPNAPVVNPVDNSIFVPATPGSTVEVVTNDTAGNTNVSKPTSDAGNDANSGNNPNVIVIPGEPTNTELPTEKTAEPTALTITAMKDNSNPADNNPEEFRVTGKVPNAKVGTLVTITDDEGNLLGSGKTTDAEGNFDIVAVENGKDLDRAREGTQTTPAKPADKIRVQAWDKESNKQPSTFAEKEIEGDITEYADKTAPLTPNVIANPVDGSVVVTLPQDAVAGDKVVIELKQTGSAADAKPTRIVLTKNDDGSWTNADPALANKLVPDAVDGQTSVTIPESVIEDGSIVKAWATDIAGNNSDGKDFNQAIAGNDKRATKLSDVIVDAIDTNEVADKTAEVVVLGGKTDPFATVDIKDKAGINRTVKADAEGNFKVIIAKQDNNTDATIAKLKEKMPELASVSDTNIIKTEDPLDAKEFTFVAKSDNKFDSVEVVRPVPALEATQEDHPFDSEPPAVKPSFAEEAVGTDETVNLPENAQVGDRVLVDYTDETSGEKKQILVEKVADNNWKLVDPKNPTTELTPAPEGITLNNNQLTLDKGIVKNGSDITAKTQDFAGNSTEPVTKTANFDTKTEKPTLEVTPVDIASAADKTMEAVLISGSVPNEDRATISIFTKAKDPANAEPTKLGEVTAAIRASDTGEVADNTNAQYTALLVKKGMSDGDKEKLKTKYELKDDQIIEVDELPKVGDKLTAQAQHLDENKKPDEAKSDPSEEKALEELGNNIASHPFDKTPPAAATIERPTDVNKADDKGDAIITLPTKDQGIVEGDKLTITYQPQVEGQPDAPAKDVVYTFDGENWVAPKDVPDGFTIADGKLRIDAPHIADNSTITTKVTDLAGKDNVATDNTSATVGTDPTFTHKPVNVTSYTTDTSDDADKTPETWVIEGKAPAGSTVYLKDKAGNIIAKATTDGGTSDTDPNGFGTFKFTVTQGTATATGENAPANNATVADFNAIKAGSEFTVSAKKNGEAEGVATDKLTPADVAEGTNISKIEGTEIKAEAELFNGIGGKKEGDYNAGNITVDKTAPTDPKITEKPEDYFLVAKEDAAAPNAVRPFVDGDFTYTSARQVDGKEVHTDITAPNATVEVLKEGSGNIAARNGGKQETNANLGFKVTTDKTVEGDTITVVRYKAGSGVNAGNADNNEKATYKFTNGAWTLVEDAEELSADGKTVPATLGEGENKPTTFTFTPSANLVKPGDLFVITYKDFAGNAKQAMKVVQPDMLFDGTPKTADVPDIILGTMSSTGQKDKELTTSSGEKIKPNEHKFVLNAANGINEVNSGDVVFRPGKDNVKLEVSYFDNEGIQKTILGLLQPESGASNRATDIFKFYMDTVVLPSDASVGKRVSVTYTDKQNAQQKVMVEKVADGWKFVDPTSGGDIAAPKGISVEEGRIKFQQDFNDNGQIFGDDGIIRQTLGEDGTYYYAINGDKVKDATPVSILGIDGEGNNSYEKPTLVEGETKKATEVLAGFDDNTDSAVEKPAVSQADQNADIVIKPTAQDPATDDAVAYVITFDATHLSKESTAAYGLNAEAPSDAVDADLPAAQGVNHIVVSRDADGKWSASLIKGEGTADGGKSDKLLADALSDVLNGNPAASGVEIPAAIGTVTPTGIFNLNKDFVKAGSKVTVKAVDAYGNTNNAEDFSVKHTQDITPVDQPVITELGFGRIHVDFGANNDKVKIASFLENSDVIEVTRNPKPAPGDDGNVDATAAVGPEFSIKVGNGETPLTADQLAAKGIVFDEDTGRVTLKTPTDKNDIVVTGYRGNDSSRPISMTLNNTTEDPTPNSVDEIEGIEGLLDGSVTFKPGADNTKVTVKYTKEDGTAVEVILNKTDNTWKPATNADDFDEASLSSPAGVIKLKADAVKDMTKVEVKGENAKGLVNEGTSTLAGKDDTTADRAAPPEITEIVATPAADNVPKVTPGADNNRVEIKFTPKADANPTEKTITAVLKPGGKWALEENGVPVNDDVATIDPATGVVKINTPLQGGTKVNATGTDPHFKSAPAEERTVPTAGTGGNPNNGGESDSKPADTSGDLTQSGNVPAFKQESGNDGSAQILRAGPDNGEIHFNVYDGSAVKGMILYDDNTYALGNPINSPGSEVSGASGKMDISNLNGFVTGSNGNYTITSKKGGYRLVADSIREPEVADTTNGLLSITSLARIPDFENGGYSTIKPGNVSEYNKNGGYALNTKVYNAGLPPSNAFALEAPKEGDNQGAVIIKPKDTTTYTYPVTVAVKYIDESGIQQSATLKKAPDSDDWELTSDHPEHFDMTQGNPILRADALEDKHHNGVSIKVEEEGKRPTVWESATPWLDPVPTETEVPEPPTTNGHFDNNEHSLNTSDARNSIAGDDILTRDWPNRDVRSDGLNEIAKNEKGLTVTTNNGKTVITANKVGDGEGSENNTLLVNGSIGDTAPSVFKFPRQDIEINMGKGNDIVATKNHLGDYKGYNTLNLGEGNDLVTVGTGGDFFKLYEKKGETNPAKRFDFAETGKNVPNGTALNALEQGGYERGGSMVNTTINGGAGNDVVAVEGDVRADRAAIGHGVKIDLGDGHDAVIIAPNNANSKSQRGEISDGAVVDFGSGNDYLKAVGLRNGAKVNMGEGNDEVVLDRILSGNTVLNTGSGNDTVTIGMQGYSGEARDGAQINLGEGNDTLRFKAVSQLWGGSLDKEARFMAKLDGGAGYDTFVLETPKQQMGGVFTDNITHLSTKYIKNIEEVQMARGSAFDISIGDLWKQAPGVLRINSLGLDSDPLRDVNKREHMGDGTVGERVKYRVVDLGETNTNSGTETYKPSKGTSGTFNGYDRVGSAQGFWKQVMKEDGQALRHTEEATDVKGNKHSVTYDVYRFGNDARYEVWIEHGIEVI